MNEQNLTVYDFNQTPSIFHYLHRTWGELSRYRYALYNFVKTNLRNKYRRSSLGFLWSLLNPVFSMIVVTVIFSVLNNADPREFGVYIFSGLLPWQLISAAITSGCYSIIYAEGYLKKVYTPKILFPMVTTTTETVNFTLSLISLFLVSLVLRPKIGVSLLFLPLAILITYVFILGCVVTIGVATVYFRDLIHITQVLFTALFYMAPIVYRIELFPPQYQIIFKINPFYYFINLFQKIIFFSEIPSLTDWIICLVIGISMFVIGVFYLSKREKDIIYRL